LIRRLQVERGVTVLLATHRDGDAAALGAAVVTVRGGRAG